MTEPLTSFRPWREWVATNGGDVFAAPSSFEWFCRRHRAPLVESGQLILRPGKAGNLVGPEIGRIVLDILRAESLRSLPQEEAA